VRQTVKPYIERKISKSDAPYNMTFKCVTAYRPQNVLIGILGSLDILTVSNLMDLMGVGRDRYLLTWKKNLPFCEETAL
jgi:hypothetical protein